MLASRTSRRSLEQGLSEAPSLGGKGFDEFTPEKLKLHLAPFQVSRITDTPRYWAGDRFGNSLPSEGPYATRARPGRASDTTLSNRRRTSTGTTTNPRSSRLSAIFIRVRVRKSREGRDFHFAVRVRAGNDR